MTGPEDISMGQKLLQAEVKRVAATGDWPEVVALVDGAKKTHLTPAVAARYVRALVTVGDERAAGIASAMIARFEANAELLVVASRALAVTERWRDAVVCLEAAYNAGAPPDKSLVPAAKLLIRHSENEDGLDFLDRSRALGVPMADLRVSYALVALQRRDYQAAQAVIDEGRLVGEAPANLEKIAQKLVDWRNAERKQSRLKATPFTSGDALVRTILPQSDILAPARYRSDQLDIMVDLQPGAKALVIEWSGLGAMIAGLLPRATPEVRDTGAHCVTVADNRLFTLGGLKSVGGFSETAAFFRELAAVLGVERTVCIGSSAGGYPAIRYALEIGADEVITFAAPTTLSFAAHKEGVDHRGEAVFLSIYEAVPEMCSELRPLLEAAADRGVKLTNFCGADMPQDRYHAERIEGAPNVTTVYLENVGEHGVAGVLRKSGNLAGIIAAAVDGKSGEDNPAQP